MSQDQRSPRQMDYRWLDGREIADQDKDSKAMTPRMARDQTSDL